MIESNSKFLDELNNVNDKVLNFAILVSTIFSIPGLIGLANRVKDQGLEWLYLFQVFLMVAIIILYLLRKKISFLGKFISYMILVIVLMLSFTLNMGMLGYWSNDIILVSLLFSLFFKKRYAFISLIILSISIGIIGYLFYSNYFSLSFDAESYINSYSIWTSMIITFLYISIITIFTIGSQRNFFISSLKELTIAKENAQGSEQKFKNIFNSSTDGIIISNFEGKILEANNSLLSFIGVSKKELENKTTRDFVLPEYHELLKKRTEDLIQNKPVPLMEVLIQNTKNEVIPIEINTILINYNDQEVVFSVIRDISERRRLEQKILSTVIQTEEKERSRFAKELHDGVGPLLSATKIYAKALPGVENEEEKLFTLMKLNETVNEAIRSAQEIANNISPHVLRNFGLTGAIQSFYQKINKTSPVIFNFQSNLDQRIDENVETTLYRVVVELINNSIKYANAKSITIKLSKKDESISLKYMDDGKGFKLKETLKNNTGMGLSNMQTRITSLNGKINMSSEVNKGFQVNILIDL